MNVFSGKTRVFFSFHVPETVGENLLRDMPQDAPITWYPKENLHVTLQFVGEVTPDELEKLLVLGLVVAENSPVIKFVPTKFFIEDRLRLGIQKNPALETLHENIVTCLKKIGVGKIDPQPYQPHITLGRPQRRFDPDSVTINPQKYVFEMHEFGLYKSEPGENKMGQYILLKSFTLLAQAEK